MKKAQHVDEYISWFPIETQEKLMQMRETIRKVAPTAEEVISYAMPAFKLNGILVYYAAYANHIGFYPTSTGIETFKDELGDYVYSKGAIQFPLNKKLPLTLIRKMVKHRIEMNSKPKPVKTKSKK